MGNKLYVGNLAYSVRDQDLQDAFAEYGAVASAKVMMDRETGRSKGFGFVEMASAEVAQAAISALHGMSVDGRSIVVNLARPPRRRWRLGWLQRRWLHRGQALRCWLRYGRLRRRSVLIPTPSCE